MVVQTLNIVYNWQIRSEPKRLTFAQFHLSPFRHFNQNSTFNAAKATFIMDLFKELSKYRI